LHVLLKRWTPIGSKEQMAKATRGLADFAMYSAIANWKVLCWIAGLGGLLLTSTPQSPETARAYLEEKGYASVAVQPAAERCGKGRKSFWFTARADGGRKVSGHLCMSDHAYFYSLREDR
jgi:hypothetical protein